MHSSCRCLLGVLLLAGSSCTTVHHASSSPGSVGIDLLALKQKKKHTCAAACLAAVAGYWRESVDESEIEHELGPVPSNGYTLKQLRDWAVAHNFHAFVIQGTLDDLEYHTARGRPLITCVKVMGGNHSVVVTGISLSGDIIAMDPKHGKSVTYGRAQFEKMWNQLGAPMLIVSR